MNFAKNSPEKRIILAEGYMDVISINQAGFENVVAENGRVLLEGDFNMLARANINSRFCERILINMGEFTATTFTQLCDGVKSLPFEDFIGKDDTLFALVDGVVRYERMGKDKKKASVYPNA